MKDREREKEENHCQERKCTLTLIRYRAFVMGQTRCDKKRKEDIVDGEEARNPR